MSRIPILKFALLVVKAILLAVMIFIMIIGFFFYDGPEEKNP